MSIKLGNGVTLSDGFYNYLLTMRYARPEDILVVLSSESGLNPGSTKGAAYHGLNTIGLNEASAIGLSQAEWDAIPAMTPEQNLPIVDKYYQNLITKIGRKGFANAFDLYLSNAAYGVWALGHISPDQIMYPAGSAWNANYPLDNYPVAAGKKLDEAKAMVAAGQLKGYVSVDDLRKFMLRENVRPIWTQAVKGLYDYMATAGISRSGGVYQPAGQQSVPTYEPGTSYDEINAAHAGGKATPSSGAGSIPSAGPVGELPWWVKLGAAFGVSYLGYKAITK